MGNPAADGFYKLTFFFPDSAVGKTLFYRYQTATKRYILHPVVLENKSRQLFEDKWGYIDDVQGKVKPAQPIVVRDADTPEEVAMLAKPFVRITTDGKPIEHLFPLKKTGW